MGGLRGHFKDVKLKCVWLLASTQYIAYTQSALLLLIAFLNEPILQQFWNEIDNSQGYIYPSYTYQMLPICFLPIVAISKAVANSVKIQPR